MPKYTVIGAGNGGQAMAAILKNKGNQVSLWTGNLQKVEKFRKRNNKITVTGIVEFEINVDEVTANIKEALEGASMVLVVLPANAHSEITSKLIPHINKDQTIILNPGRTAGALEVRNVFLEHGVRKEDIPNILETQSLFCACRANDLGVVNILSFKKENVISGIPFLEDRAIIEQCKIIYDNLVVVDSTLETGLDNMGAFLHPTPVLLNTGWIETRNTFFSHYYQRISPSVANYIEHMDNERLDIARKLDVKVRSVKEWHEEVYGSIGENLYETLKKNSAYASIDAPKTITHRYLMEDIPTGLVPISGMGKLVNIETPYIDTIIKLGSLITNMDFILTGRNTEKLGINNKNISQIQAVFRGF